MRKIMLLKTLKALKTEKHTVSIISALACFLPLS